METDLIARIVLFITMGGSGAAIIWMARAAASGKLKRNSLAGIRTPTTMASDEAWLAAHVRAKRPTLVAGYVACVIAACTLLPISTTALTIGVLIGAVLMLLVMLWATRVGTKVAVAVADTAR
ncbi:SdpI family protein [Microbacterium sp. cf332]|uniref:SdpI family protein n=1 Tax=Microbacterium sp. cf332 TaxID=1761804 RepID=UPI000B80AF3D|nr:SdpI family protein [Microbacterium sp. cf332]